MSSDHSILIRLLPLFFMLSCSVKENRDDCPSYLGLDLTDVKVSMLDSLGFDTLDILLSGHDSSYINHAIKFDNMPDHVWLPVNKGEAGFMVLCGNGADYLEDSGIVIPEGKECPMVFGYGKSYTASEEVHRDTVRLHKHSCMMDVRFLKQGSYKVEIEGGVCGFDRHMSPVEGLFSCEASTSGGSSLKVCLPRQLDSSLMMRVSAGGKVSSYFRLGAYLERSGYDWNAPDLEDISLTVDYTSSVITFSLDKDSKRAVLNVAI